MRLRYTQGDVKEPIYLTDEQYEIVKDIKLYASSLHIVYFIDGKSKQLTSILYPNISRVCRIDNTVYDYRPSNIKGLSATEKYGLVGIATDERKNGTYYVGTVQVQGRQLRVPGYYRIINEAILAREAYIVKNKIETKARNDIGLSDQDILKEYLTMTEKRKKESSQVRSRSRRSYAITSEKYGISRLVYNGDVFYCATVKGKTIGKFRDINITKCLRNLYIIDNSIKDDKVYNVGMSIEEQRQIVAEYKKSCRLKSYQLKAKKGNKYVGVTCINPKRGTRYVVQVYNEGKRVYLGESKDIELAAMLYNIYQVKVGKVRESINDVGMTIDEQIKTLEKKGYYMTEDFRFKKTKRD